MGVGMEHVRPFDSVVHRRIHVTTSTPNIRVCES